MVAAGPPASTARRRRRPDVETGRLRVHDPFELVRWLALSQPDPRKALAELVQNSLDVGARAIRVVRRREKGRACLLICDDGEEVIPEFEQLVEVAAYADRRLAAARGGRRKGQPRKQSEITPG